jgi:hypothetical protein
MPRPPFFELPRTASGRAFLITMLYAMLAFIALYVPIAGDSPFALLFGTKMLARQVAIAFVQSLFWPVVALIAYTVAQPLLSASRKG